MKVAKCDVSKRVPRIGRPGEYSAFTARNFVIKVPPVDEQYEIIRRVNMLLELADTIERGVAAATARADRLT